MYCNRKDELRSKVVKHTEKMAKLQADKLDLMGDHAMENGQLATAEHWYDKADAIREEYGIEEDIGPGMKKMRDFFRNLR